MENRDAPMWESEFSEFTSAVEVKVPTGLSQVILNKVSRELHPSPFLVFGKLAVIQAVVGAATILFCPQFGISLTSSRGLMPYLMKYGDNVCMLGCGAFFTAITLLAASLLLAPEEVRVLRRRELLQLATLATFSLLTFAIVGGEIALSLAVAWALGAILGGAITFEAGWFFRKRQAGSFA